MLSPWETEDKYKDTRNAESASQRALFMFANMAANFGLNAADYPDSYRVAGSAKNIMESMGDKPVTILKYLFAIHNQGHGDAIHGAKAVAEGLKKGVPDLALPISIKFNGEFEPWFYHGLYIELKRKEVLTEGKRKALIQARTAGKASTEQEDWQQFLRNQGYVCEIAYGFVEAKDIILSYLKEGGLI